MRETTIMDNLTCKMQAPVRVCKENKLEEKMTALKKSFIERSNVRHFPRNSEERDFSVFNCDDTP